MKLKNLRKTLSKLKALIGSKIKQLYADLRTLKNAFWNYKTGFLPVFLETLIKHFILLILVYLTIIYGSAYYIFKIHDVFYYEFSYIVTLITLRLVLKLPVIIEMCILTSPVQWGAIGILKESLNLYFTLCWDYALALGLLIFNVLYFLGSVCKQVWATLRKSNNVWDRRCAYLVLVLLIIGLLIFLISWLIPFFYDLYKQGWATTVVSYLWKSLNFGSGFQNEKADGTASHQRSKTNNTTQDNKNGFETNGNGKAYSPSEPTLIERLKSYFGKPKP